MFNKEETIINMNELEKIKDILKAKHKLPKLTSELNTNVNAFQLLTHRFISSK